ncbi:phage head-tail adapter protein [Bacillus cereus]|uniref:Phage head-tail adapter protein n=1 Tax=Bacillus cereus TaxID=1396 RepID=A0A9X7CQU4_BACCE|nr:head-tail adaptor protein [Bacillus cereus]PGS81634.1 phage head-tail adapter protein [Bacillus cereus]
MYPTQDFIIQKPKRTPDGIGGYLETWSKFKTVQGYLDLVNGTNLSSLQNAFTEESTHLLIIPEYTDGITDEMRVLDSAGRFYSITYPDNPMGIGHHNELYLTYGGAVNG